MGSIKKLTFLRGSIIALALLFPIKGVVASNSFINFTDSSRNSSDLISKYNEVLMLLDQPNVGGVSINTVKDFALVSGETLKIINASSLNSNLASATEADVVVINLLNTDGLLQIDGVIELVGKPAELVILTASGNDIVCNGCVFKNFTRVTLATGNAEYLTSSKEIKQLSVQKGQIRIGRRGLTASSVSFLDLLTYNLAIDGKVSTNFKNGLETIINGNTRFFIGAIDYIYGAGKVSSFGNGYSTVVVSEQASVNSGSLDVNVLNQGKITIQGELSTYGNQTLVSQYRGKNIIPSENINITSLGGVVVNSNILSSANIEVNLGGDLKIGDFSSKIYDSEGYAIPRIEGNSIRISTEGETANFGSLISENLGIYSSKVVNEGNIVVDKNALINGEIEIQNQFGGSIEAAVLSLTSAGVVTNGSLRPYRLYIPNPDLASKGGPDAVIYVDGTHQDIPDDPAGSIRVEVDDLGAEIYAGKIEINGNKVRNINPYYELFTLDEANAGAIKLDSIAAGQVIVSASDSITIIALEKILNSSAQLETNIGKLAFFSPLVINERYRVQVNTAPGAELETTFCDQYGGCVENGNTLLQDINVQYVRYLSPPGRIFSGSHAIIAPSTDSGATGFEGSQLVNEFSFFEGFGNLDVSMANVRQTGLKLTSSATIRTTHENSKRYCKRRILGICLQRGTKRWQSYSYEPAEVVTGELSVLFSVEGHLQGKGSGLFEVTTLTLD
jgi:hypothetical protein